ncbi:MAG: OsmC family protein [Bacteroidota bacterium]|nr:OsmC family protein [Bacteroidota bacterium]
MVPISVVYQGQLRCQATHDNSGIQFITDAPKDNQGRGESFSPTDLVATALGSCIITTMGIRARNDNVSLDGTTIAVEKHMSTDSPRRIAKIVVHLVMCQGISKEYRRIIEQIGHACPVARSLHPDVALEIQFRYPD